jgi:hypothetical protein
MSPCLHHDWASGLLLMSGRRARREGIEGGRASCSLESMLLTSRRGAWARLATAHERKGGRLGIVPRNKVCALLIGRLVIVPKLGLHLARPPSEPSRLPLKGRRVSAFEIRGSCLSVTASVSFSPSICVSRCSVGLLQSSGVEAESMALLAPAGPLAGRLRRRRGFEHRRHKDSAASILGGLG